MYVLLSALEPLNPETSYSENARNQRLITGIDLCHLKPSQLIQKLRSVATSDVSENLFKTLWLGKLPDSIQNVLIVSKEDIDRLAIMADKICDMSPKTEIYSTSDEHNSSNELLDRVKNLEQQIAALCIRTGARPRARIIIISVIDLEAEVTGTLISIQKGNCVTSTFNFEPNVFRRNVNLLAVGIKTHKKIRKTQVCSKFSDKL
ncbi:hypothetical protein AVEN_233579-1 [Araneus ventricosus]|uniref:Uncharacterized protein n=1 Tax=Araneus ventricosus TaxID=182803 RepID=A0A4Y2HPR7_ARAVE|nr:hypothetical protein AVEN_233579-1 [Araneus ventricosus]